MARLEYVETSEAPDEVREAYALLGGPVPGNAWKILAHAPELMKPLLGLRNALYGDDTRVGDRVRQLVSIRVSALNECRY